jgi:hypothetical protein
MPTLSSGTLLAERGSGHCASCSDNLLSLNSKPFSLPILIFPTTKLAFQDNDCRHCIQSMKQRRSYGERKEICFVVNTLLSEKSERMNATREGHRVRSVNLSVSNWVRLGRETSVLRLRCRTASQLEKKSSHTSKCSAAVSNNDTG